MLINASCLIGISDVGVEKGSDTASIVLDFKPAETVRV